MNRARTEAPGTAPPRRAPTLVRIGAASVASRGLSMVLLLCVAPLGCGGRGGEAEANPTPASAPPPLDPAVEGAIASGKALFFDRAVCFACHRVGEEGTMIVGPNLGIGDGMEEAVAGRASRRRPGLSPIEYVVESMLDPDAVVVPSYAPGVMKSVDDMPQRLDDDEIVALAAFVASQGAPDALAPADLAKARDRIATTRGARAEPRR